MNATTATSENTFETAITQSLIENGGYTAGIAKDYNPKLGMFEQDVLQFLRATQPQQWEKITAIHRGDVENRVIQRLIKEIDLRGSLDVIRNGFVDYGVRFKMAFFKPESGLNADTQKLYDQNELKITRQVHYSDKNKKLSVDLVSVLNGLPVVTIELKNQFTGQNTSDAKKQYAIARDNNELLFAFKKRALVHFAVDDDEVYMTTHINGDKTHWLPFNKGYNYGKGNSPNSNGYKTDYLWREILTKDSWLEIIGRFIHLQKEEFSFDGKIHKKEKLVFPRFHQLDAVRKISQHVQTNGVGHNYLIQHSAGSGKSNSIAWLAYRLSGLHNAANKRIFDGVIVVTDRKILDTQLQDTIYQFEHKQGVVQRIDKDSQQLANAINGSTNIIITTLQKFPFVVDKVSALPNRKYAIIIDEAHSSQGGEASKKMKEVLGCAANDAVRLKVAQPTAPYDIGDTDDYDAEDLISEEVERSAAARGQQPNLSFFAFTATPKYKTLAVFGHKNSQEKPQPFHLYSMKQAIEEGFILDVLQHYTTYALYFKLTKAIADDPQINKKKATQAIARFVTLHPHNLAQKTEIIVEHFRQVVVAKIGGKAKAMLVTASRLHAKRYFEEFKRYLKEKGYEQHIKILVAFSGKILDDNFPDGVTEPQLTGFGEKELPKNFERDEYKILIVADKYQTGFDQPLLHTMYIDKQLSGVKAVQTLSRLNRTAPGKEDTFVLDFVNDRKTILDSFQPYYETSLTSEDPEPNHLYDLKNKLDEWQIYLASEVENFSSIYFNPKMQTTVKTQALLYACIDPAVERYREIKEKNQQEEFKKKFAYLDKFICFPRANNAFQRIRV